jgi:hypothetical protein
MAFSAIARSVKTPTAVERSVVVIDFLLIFYR